MTYFRKKQKMLILVAVVLFFLLWPRLNIAYDEPLPPTTEDTRCNNLNPSYRSMICRNNLCGGIQMAKIACPCDTSYCCYDPGKNIPICSYQPTTVVPQVGEITLQQPLPGFEGAREVTGNTIGEYISAFYRYFAGAAGILATVMILFSGFQWVTASGNASQIEKAKSTMNGALIGLVLTLTAYVLLYAINPNLVKWSTISLSIIPRKTLEKQEQAALTAECPGESELAKISDFISKDYVDIAWGCSQDCKVRSAVIPMLDAAARDLKENHKMKIWVTSATRTFQRQQELYDCYVNNKNKTTCPEDCVKIGGCNLAAKASCTAPHVSGWALDICYEIAGDRSSCTKISTLKNAKKGSPDYAPQTTLQKVMKKWGFNRFCGEWWHFEGKALSPTCGIGEYFVPSQ